MTLDSMGQNEGSSHKLLKLWQNCRSLAEVPGVEGDLD